MEQRNEHDEERPTGVLPATSLRSKLLLFATAIVVIPGLLFALIVEQNGRASLESLIGGQLAREAHHTADRIATVLRTEQQSLRSFSQQELMREIKVSDIDKRISVALSTLRGGNQSVREYLVVNRERRVVAATEPGHIGTLPSWWDRVGPVGRPRDQLLGPLRIDEYPEASLFITTPIADPDRMDSALGLLIGIYDWQRLISLTEGVQQDLASQGTRTEVVVADRDGKIIGGTKFSAPSAAALAEEWSEALAARSSLAPEYVLLPGSKLLVGRAAIGPDLAERQLFIIESLADAFAPSQALTRRLALILALTLAAALGIAALAAGRVVRPLSELTRAIRSLSRRDLPALRIPVRSEDEVGTLARTFNRMASELDQAQRDLVEASKFALVGELAGGVAHEVRTSLGVLRSSTQILQRSLPADLDAESAELAELILAEVDRLGTVVTELITLGRPRPPHFEDTPLWEPLQRAIDFAEPQARAKNVQIHRDPDSPRVLVRCDPELLYQVALNLIVNGIQAAHSSGNIEVSLVPCRAGSAAFEVRDDGPGIPEDFLDKVFSPFATRREGGIGLGLTFVQRVVYEHRGSIEVRSEPGTGACFHVEIPVADPANDEPTPEEREEIE